MTELSDAYAALRPRLSQLETEADFVVRAALEQSGIKIHGISRRVKDLASLAQKCDRLGLNPETCEDLLDCVNDLVGLRIICLYRSDIDRIVGCLNEAFNVVQTDSKEFGSSVSAYQSTHLVVTLPTTFSGTRYDGILGVRFEVQVRTICMDAWASISHHLAYKTEDSVPPEARRSFTALGGLLYVADTEFESLRDEIAAAQSRMDTAAQEDPGRLLPEPVSVESLNAYLRSLWPSSQTGQREQVAAVAATANTMGVRTLRELQSVLEEWVKAGGIEPTPGSEGTDASGWASSALAHHDPAGYAEAMTKIEGQPGYCVKCKEKVVPVDLELIQMKNGRPALKGKCPQCGTKVFKILTR